MNTNLGHIDVAILGAGVAGLAAAKKAKQLNLAAKVFEASNSIGGLLDNYTINGYRFDNAVHLSFANEPEVRSVFDTAGYYSHPSDSYCFDHDRWLKHPVQNNLARLDVDTKVELIKSFVDRQDVMQDDNYEQWLRHQYGDAISERYPIKYTKKYWQHDAKELSTTWIGNRMRRAEIDEILRGSYTDDTPNTYYTKEMRYPKKGGFKSFLAPLAESADVLLNHKVTKIDLGKNILHFSNGCFISFGKLVSSIPLPTIIDCLGTQVPNEVLEATQQLKSTSIDLISVGFNETIIKDLWFYIYDNDILASRAYSPSQKSSDNVPQGCSSLQFEIYNPGRQSQYTPDELKENVSYALEKMGISDGKNVEFIHHKHIPWGNVIFTLGMENHRDKVLAFLSEQKIASVGRFGEWEYFWSNQSFLSGFNWDKL
ncbi:protoporphyrinogen oxidase [Vibrio campbellii]|uniref:protoporphyrinogen/coproporphyrinogen oxidase n=1 Tax=Vibrio campbellii TaxID=680 RepID=UPI0005314291|nr:FAD-dependent oxidoreductase [Vibrio campbellii]KGR34529.1 protoporphyrinogen oxidase [Vibrio campbellii]